MRLGAALAAVAAVLSLGPRLDVAGAPSAIPLPEALLAKLPLLDSAIPARFELEVALGAAIVLAVGLDRSARQLAAAGRGSLPAVRQVALAVAGCLAVVCYLPAFPLSSKALPPEHDVLEALRADVAPGAVVLSYPYALSPYDEAMLWQARDAMRFSLVGGYATVPGRNGGQWWPELLTPPSVQEALELDELHRPLHYPRPPRGAGATGQLCAFVLRYGVDDVVMRLGRGVPREVAVERSFVASLGRPRRVGADALVWVDLGTPTSACRRAATRRSLSSAPSRG